MKKKLILLLAVTVLGINSCSLFFSNPELRIVSDKLYGRITANGVDITEKVHSGEYEYYQDEDITFEYIPYPDLDVEFLGWYYIKGFITKQETEITSSLKINTREIGYRNIHPKIKTPEVDFFYEDPVSQNTLIEISKDKQKFYRYLTFKDGVIESIEPLVLENSIYIHGVRDGKIYYSKNKIFYSYNMDEDKHSVILDYSYDAVDLEFYCDTGFLLISQFYQGEVIEFSVLNIDSGQTEYYMPSAALKIGEAFLSGDGNIIIIAERYQDDQRIVRINISDKTSTVLVPILSEGICADYGIIDSDDSGNIFSYRVSYWERTNSKKVYRGGGFFIYVDGKVKKITSAASYDWEGWTQIMKEEEDGDETTVFYSLSPDTIKCTKLFTLPFYRRNIKTRYVRKTGASKFVFRTPDKDEKFYGELFHQFGFYNYNDDEIYIIPAANIIDCKIKYFQDYTK